MPASAIQENGGHPQWRPNRRQTFCRSKQKGYMRQAVWDKNNLHNN